MSEGICRRFRGRDYYLDKMTTTKRLADSAAKSYRNDGYLARVTMIDHGRWGVWIYEYLEGKVQLWNPIKKKYALVDTGLGKILRHSPTRFKNVRYVSNMSVRGDGDKSKRGGKNEIKRGVNEV